MLNLENSYAFESERRKDEMRAAAESQFLRQIDQRRETRVWPVAILGALTRLLAIFLGR
jgi:hypothetical protein